MTNLAGADRDARRRLLDEQFDCSRAAWRTVSAAGAPHADRLCLRPRVARTRSSSVPHGHHGHWTPNERWLKTNGNSTMSARTGILRGIRRRCHHRFRCSASMPFACAELRIRAVDTVGSVQPIVDCSGRSKRTGAPAICLGTVHAWKREWLPLNPTIEKAFADSKTLAVELDAAKMDMASAVQRMMLAGNETLETRLGKSLYEQTRSRSRQTPSTRGGNCEGKAVGRDAGSSGDQTAATGI